MKISVLHEGDEFTFCADEKGSFWEWTKPLKKSMMSLPGMIVRTNMYSTLHSIALKEGYTKEDFDSVTAVIVKRDEAVAVKIDGEDDKSHSKKVRIAGVGKEKKKISVFKVF